MLKLNKFFKKFLRMELEDTMASLRINDNMKKTVDLDSDSQLEASIEDEEAFSEPRRSQRLRTHITYTEKRRVFTKPMKVTKEHHSESDLENYYLDKRIKRLSPALETIYEDSNSETCMSKRKLHRKMNFSIVLKKEKAKKRKMKAKNVSSQQRLKNKHKIPLAYLLETLNKIDE